MIHSQYAKKIMTWLCTAAMLIPSGLASDSLPVKASVTPVPEDTVVLETDVSTPHDGCTIAGVYGTGRIFLTSLPAVYPTPQKIFHTIGTRT